jgi:hypothetical protein
MFDTPGRGLTAEFDLAGRGRQGTPPILTPAEGIPPSLNLRRGKRTQQSVLPVRGHMPQSLTLRDVGLSNTAECDTRG